MLTLLAGLFGQQTEVLCKWVVEVLQDPPELLCPSYAFWRETLYCCSDKSFQATWKQFLHPAAAVDGYFVVVLAVLFYTHLAIANLDGLWTTRADGY